MTAALQSNNPPAGNRALAPPEAVTAAIDELNRRASALGLRSLASAGWPETEADGAPPALAGFVASDFSPMIAAVADRCLRRAGREPAERRGTASLTPTAIVIMSPLGDVTSAAHVARAVDEGARVGPLLFFQAVPNAVAGHVAARFGLAGPVVCLGSGEGGVDVAGLLIDDGDASQALVVLAESDPERAVAVLVETPPHHAESKGELR